MKIKDLIEKWNKKCVGQRELFSHMVYADFAEDFCSCIEEELKPLGFNIIPERKYIGHFYFWAFFKNEEGELIRIRYDNPRVIVDLKATDAYAGIYVNSVKDEYDLNWDHDQICNIETLAETVKKL